MAMISSSTDANPSTIVTSLSKASPLSPATQSDTVISHANRAAALETASSKSEERKALQGVITTFREESEKLKSEMREVVRRLEATETSHEALRSQASTLKEINMTQQDNIKSLRAELIEVEDKYNRFMVDSNAEKAALQARVLDLEAQQDELKEAIVEQQVRVLKLERRETAEEREAAEWEQAKKVAREEAVESAPKPKTWASLATKREPAKKGGIENVPRSKTWASLAAQREPAKEEAIENFPKPKTWASLAAERKTRG